MFTIEKTQDEDGQDVFFVADEESNWVSDPMPTIEEAREELKRVQADA